MLVLSRGRKRRPANTAFSKASQLKLQPRRPRTPQSPLECVGSASIFDQMPDLVMRELSALISFTDWLRASQVLTAWRPFPPQRLTLSDSDIWYNLPANVRVPIDHVLLRIDTENGGPSGPFGACPVILRAISHFGLSLDSVTSIDLSRLVSKRRRPEDIPQFRSDFPIPQVTEGYFNTIHLSSSVCFQPASLFAVDVFQPI
ncbi:hypothetical protein AAHC03_0678 [Spirometra sp. Aus1]